MEITDTATGTTTTLRTNGEGRYTAPSLLPGTYDVVARAQGFTTQKRTQNVLTVGASIVVNFTLAVGSSSQTITITASAAQLETETTEQGATIGQTQIEDLPLNGRNYDQLLLQAPGVQPVNTGTQGSFYGRDATISVAGARPEGQYLLLDGADIQGAWGHGAGNIILGTSLGVDAIGEFQVLTGTYSARYGGSGSAMNAATRSGTNKYHGSAYEFVRNNDLDALDYFDSPLVPHPFKRNQFGASLGGPVKKDKAFFFANYEGLQLRQGLTLIENVPDANTIAGYLPLPCAPQPCTGSTLTYVGPIDPAVQAVLNLYANAPVNDGDHGDGTGYYRSVQPEPGSENFVTTRWDYTFSPKNSAFARYIFDTGSITDPTVGSPTDLYPEVSNGQNNYATIGDKMTFSSSLVNVATVSFIRTYMHAASSDNYSALDFYPGESLPNGQITFGPLFIGPYSFDPALNVLNNFMESDDLFWVKGNHTLEAGAEFSRWQSNMYNDFFMSGSYTFPTLQDFLQDDQYAASYLGSAPGLHNTYRGFREDHFAPYVEDTWKAKPDLTINLGLRWEFSTNGNEVHNLLWAFENPASDAGFTHVSHVYGTNPSVKNFEPRLGVAWSPFRDTKTVIRAGGGMFYDLQTARFYQPAYLFAGPAQVNYVALPGFPNAFTSPIEIPLIFIGEAEEYKVTGTPYTAQYNLNVQRQLTNGLIASVAYVGSQSRNLLSQLDNNPIVPTTDPNGRLDFGAAGTVDGDTDVSANGPRVNPNPGVGSLMYSKTIGPSNYNSLQASLNGNVANQLRMQLSYTYSHCLDEAGEAYGLEGNQGADQIQNPYNLRGDYGPCNFDLRHVFTGNLIYAMPFKTSEAVANGLIQGWQLSGIISVHSGIPFSALDGFDRADLNTNADGAAERPDLVAGRSSNPHVGKVNEWFDPTAFTLQPPGEIGNVGKGTIRGPNLAELDLGAAKTFKIRETMGLMFRADAYNLFNHPNFGLPNFALYSGPACTQEGSISGDNCLGAGIPNSTAGAITSTLPQAPPRELQLALKFIF